MVLLDDGENIFTVDPDALHDEWELLEVALDCMFDLQKVGIFNFFYFWSFVFWSFNMFSCLYLFSV